MSSRNSYIRSFLGKGDSDRAAESAVPSGNERYLALEFLRTMLSTILSVRPGLHLGLKARLAILVLPGTRQLFFFL